MFGIRLFSLFGLFLIPEEVLQFVHKLMDIFELAVNGGKTDIGDSIETMQFFHHLLSDLGAFDLPLPPLLEIRFDSVHALLDDIDADRPLFAGLLQAIEDFHPIEGFSATILFNDQRKGIFGPLTGGESFLAFEAFPPAPDRLLVFGQTGINNLALWMMAEGAFHRSSGRQRVSATALFHLSFSVKLLNGHTRLFEHLLG